MNIIRVWSLCLLALGLSGCAVIQPPTSPLLDHYIELSGNVPTTATVAVPAKENRPKIFIASCNYIRGHSQSSWMASALNDSLKKQLTWFGYPMAYSEEQSDVVISCTVRNWWAPSGLSVLICIFTGSIYTPIWYPWVIEINFYDRQGRVLGDVYEKGRVCLHCVGTVFVPGSLVQGGIGLQLCSTQLADNAARMVISKLPSLDLARAMKRQ